MAKRVVGEVRGRLCVVIDDMVDTGGTIAKAVEQLLDEGASDVVIAATHGVLSGPAVDRIQKSSLREVVVTDTIPLPAAKQIHQIKTLSVAPLIGEAIKRIHRGESVGALFSSEVSFTQEMLLWSDGQQGRMDTRHEPDHEADGGPGARGRSIARVAAGGRDVVVGTRRRG